MRWLVTGASGFTGRHLVARLRAAGEPVLGLGAGPGDDLSCDLLDAPALADCVRRSRPDAVIHLAAISHVAHADEGEFDRVNVGGTANLLAACAALPVPPRVILASSAAVYGRQGGVLAESAPVLPVNAYGRSKAAMESLAADWGDRLPLVVTRPFNYTGPGQDTRFLVPKLAAAFARRDPVIQLGNLGVARDFSDVRDVVEDYLLLAAADCAGTTVNLCSGRILSIGDLLARLQAVTGHRPSIRFDPSLARSDEIPILGGSDLRLRALTGRGHATPMEETLAALLESHRTSSRGSKDR